MDAGDKAAGTNTSAGPASWVVRAGAPTSPVIIHVPHASLRITDDAAASVVLAADDIAEELRLMTDFGTDVMALLAQQSAAITPWVFENQLSRLVIDPERLPDDIEEMAAVGMGAVYVKTSDGRKLRDIDAAGKAALISRYFDPYAAAMTDAVTQRMEACGRAIVIDLHSYPLKPLPYELRADGPRPHMCLGTNEMHTPPWVVEAARTAFAGFGEIGLDSPFPGTYVPLKHYEQDSRVSSIMFEIRRDTYMAELAQDGLLAVDVPNTTALAERIAKFIDLVS